MLEEEALLEVIILDTEEEGAALAARMIARQVREKPDSVLGLATGNSPVQVYRELVRMHREEGLDFSRVTTFNLDEYVGLGPDHPCSYKYFMRENLFRHVNLDPSRTHVPDGLATDIPAFCAEYERQIAEAGGIDLQLLGIGQDGHIAFNEPTSSLSSRTRLKTLTPLTVSANRVCFPEGEEMPTHVLTMGVGTIMEARQCVLLAFGARKAPAVGRMVEGPVTAMAPASVLQFHRSAVVILDEEASKHLALRNYFRDVYRNKPEWQRV